jgi:hypothetical protein
MTHLTRTGRPEPFNPASDKTVTVTITMKVRGGSFYEDFADRIASQARELVHGWASHFDPAQATIEVAYSYPQWKHVYGPDQEERSR